MSKEGDKILWRGVRPTAPESIFTRYEKPDGCTYVDAYASATNATVIIYTVPDDTVFFLTSVDFSVFTSANGRGRLGIRNAADVLDAYIFSPTVLANSGSVCTAQYPIARQIPEKYDIFVNSDNVNLATFGHIVGYTRSTL